MNHGTGGAGGNPLSAKQCWAGFGFNTPTKQDGSVALRTETSPYARGSDGRTRLDSQEESEMEEEERRRGSTGGRGTTGSQGTCEDDAGHLARKGVEQSPKRR